MLVPTSITSRDAARQARRRAVASLVALITLTAAVAHAAASPSKARGAIHRGAESRAPAHFDTSEALRDMPPKPMKMHGAKMRPLRILPPPLASTFSAAPAPMAAVQSSLIGAPLPSSVSNDIAGLGLHFPGFSVQSAPPDTNGAIGATQYVQWVNASFAIFDKATGATLFGPAAGNTLWTGFGGPCETNNDGDPLVVYDKAADRWVLSQFTAGGGPPFFQCVAVSTTSDATGSYNRYAFSYDQFPDYPKMGTWPDAYYITFNMFAGTQFTFAGAKLCAYDRDSMLAGLPATQQCFQFDRSVASLLPADLDGSTAPPLGAPNPALNLGNGNALNLWNFHVDWVDPSLTTLSGPTVVPVDRFALANTVPQQGTTQRLDALGDRLMYRLAYRNFGDHESLVVNHTVIADPITLATGVRWYELRDPNGTPTVFQQSTFSPDSNSRWIGSVAMDRAGNIAMGYSTSGTSLFPTIRYTGRLATDPPNTMRDESVDVRGNIYGSGSQISLSRWGDYSSMTVDPVDDCTFWYTNEYLQANGRFNWDTRIFSFTLPDCSVSPPALIRTKR